MSILQRFVPNLLFLQINFTPNLGQFLYVLIVHTIPVDNLVNHLQQGFVLIFRLFFVLGYIVAFAVFFRHVSNVGNEIIQKIIILSLVKDTLKKLVKFSGERIVTLSEQPFPPRL